MISLNTQKPMAAEQSDGEHLKVVSHFLTIQGEGPFAGRPAVFLRLYGCTLLCPKCDTDYTTGMYNPSAEQLLADANDMVKGTKTRLLVVTGGEPFRQNIEPLCGRFLACGWDVQVETNGTICPDYRPLLYSSWDDKRFTIVCSPKARVDLRFEICVTAWKFVVRASDLGESGLPTRALGRTSPIVFEGGIGAFLKRAERRKQPIYLQPEDSAEPEEYAANVEACVSACQRWGYILSIQIHKQIGLK